MGFKGVLVDRLAYDDKGMGAEAALKKMGHRGPALQSQAGDLAFYLLP